MLLRGGPSNAGDSEGGAGLGYVALLRARPPSHQAEAVRPWTSYAVAPRVSSEATDAKLEHAWTWVFLYVLRTQKLVVALDVRVRRVLNAEVCLLYTSPSPRDS